MERSRLCVDYGVTLALIHAAIIVLIRRSIWILFSIEIMLLLSSVCVCSIVMGRKSCLKKELLPIPVGTSLMNRFSDTNGTLHRSEKPISSSQWPLRIMGSYLRRTYSHFRHILSSNRTDAGVVGGDSQSLLS